MAINKENRSSSLASGKPWPRGAYFIFLVITFFVVSYLQGQKSLPELWGLHVHDESHVLSQTTIDKLENQLKAYEDSTSNELAILIISSLEGESLENYSLQVAEKWKLGKESKDNGALLLIVIDDHKMRIETGYGLEGVLTDAICSRIIRNELAPNFRQGNYEAGVSQGINAMISAIGGEYTTDEASGNAELGLKERVIIGLFMSLILGIFTISALLSPGCGGWFLYAILIPFYAVFPMVILGTAGGFTLLGVYAVCFPILKLFLAKTKWGVNMRKKIANASGRKGGWSSASGWLGGGGRSSGGFSGGGGSFGGGGSSGSW